MKNKLLYLVFVICSIFLVACNDDVLETINLEFVELEQIEENGLRAIYVSHDVQLYYALDLTGYEYVHFDTLGADKIIGAEKFDSVSSSLKYYGPVYKFEDSDGKEYLFYPLHDYVPVKGMEKKDS